MRTKHDHAEQLQFVPRWQYQWPPNQGTTQAMDLVANDLIDILHIDEQIVPLLDKKSLADAGK